MTSILIVEDEPTIAENLRFALVRDAFTVTVASLGEEALTRLRGGSFALVILDVGLPDGHGFEIFRRLRAFSDVPVIFLTARGDEIDRVAGLELGADDYVVKPFSLRELLARVHVVLRRRALQPTDPGHGPASRGGFVVDEARARINFRGHPLELTRYEFLLLKLLLEHPGRVYSREQVMDRIWPATSGTGDRTVDAHVKTLRAKIRAIAPEFEAIQTHRGLGYSLAELP